MSYLGIEFGSTRIKAVVIDKAHKVISGGDYGWKSDYKDGIWTYSLDEAWKGLKVALKSALKGVDDISAVGISGMMHGYLAFDKDWNLLVPFRTWQNTVTERAADILSAALDFNVPQRWSVAHLFQAVLNGEPHVKNVAHITTLAGYIHYMLTGVNAVGVGEASGMFPVDSATKTYDSRMVKIVDGLLHKYGIKKSVLELLPVALPAGTEAGYLRQKGSERIDGLIPVGTVFAPPEGDVQTGMAATNAVSVGCGNISAGTSVFLTVVTGKPLKNVYREVDVVVTPTGEQSAMIHANNCTNDINAWFGVLKECADLFGGNTEDFYARLFELSLKGDPDCGGVVSYNYMAGEPITGVSDGRPIVVRKTDAKFDLKNFVRAQLYGALATVRMGLEILEDEHLEIKRVTGHGGYYKTPRVGQIITSAAVKTPVHCNKSAGEGGPFGMALLAAYLESDKTLDAYLDDVFKDVGGETIEADKATRDGFDAYMERFKKGLKLQYATGGIV